MSENEERGYTLIGGNGVRVKPLEVSEDGTYKAGDSEAFNPVVVKSGGGGSGGGVLVANMDSSTGALDKTWSEITSASFAVVRYNDPNLSAVTDNAPVIMWSGNASGGGDVYTISVIAPMQDGSFDQMDFVTDSADGYPVMD